MSINNYLLKEQNQSKLICYLVLFISRIITACPRRFISHFMQIVKNQG